MPRAPTDGAEGETVIEIGGLVAMGGDAVGGVAVVVDHSPDGTARTVHERADGVLIAGDPIRGWDRASDEEAAIYRAAEPWNAH